MVANGSWQEEMAGTTPNSTGVQSSTGTPNPKDAKKPSQKMSFSDYKKFKESGVTPTLKPGAPTSEPSLSQGERSMGHERSISSTSVEKLASVAQSKGRPEVIVNGVKSSIEPVKTAVKEQTYVMLYIRLLHELTMILDLRLNHRTPRTLTNLGPLPMASA